MSDETTLANLPEAVTAENDAISQRLERFEVIKNRRLRQLVSALPAILALILLFDLLIGLNEFIRYRAFSGDWFRISFPIGIILEFLVINKVFAEVPGTFARVWRRNLLIHSVDSQQSLAEKFSHFLNQFEALLNNKWYTAIAGLVVGIGVLRGTYPFVYRAANGTFPGGISPIVYAESLVGFFFGLFVWRYAVIALTIGRLASEFNLTMQSQHPDRCGGLKPLGNLCLWNALIILIPAIILAIWLGVSQLPSFEFYDLWSPLFRQYLMLLTVLSIFFFFYPLGKIHRRMVAERDQLWQELDGLSAKAEAILGKLRNEVDSLPTEESSDYLEKLDTIKKVYDKNASIPAWPFDWRIILRFSVAQIVPILSLLGLGQPLINLIQSITSTFPAN